MKPQDRQFSLQGIAPVLIGALIVVLGVGIAVLVTSPPRGEPIKLAEPAPLRIHVAGEVQFPGVYEIPFGSIVQDAIDEAGGFTDQASQVRINLAAELTDGQQVYVPQVADEAAPSFNPAPSNDPVAINTATAPELERLPGIGPVLAQRIVEYREQFGPFQRVEDLLEVEGIGPSKLESLQDQVLVP